MDDVAHAFVVADQLGLRVNAGALQVGVQGTGFEVSHAHAWLRTQSCRPLAEAAAVGCQVLAAGHGVCLQHAVQQSVCVAACSLLALLHAADLSSLYCRCGHACQRAAMGCHSL